MSDSGRTNREACQYCGTMHEREVGICRARYVQREVVGNRLRRSAVKTQARMTLDAISHIPSWAGELYAKQLPGKWSIGTKLSPHQRMAGLHPSFDVNVNSDTCYLLNLWMPESMRGLGHGSALLSAIEDLAAAMGCTRVVITPSGEGRAEWYGRRGYLFSGGEMEKSLKAAMPSLAKLRQLAIRHPPPPEWFEGEMERPW